MRSPSNTSPPGKWRKCLVASALAGATILAGGVASENANASSPPTPSEVSTSQTTGITSQLGGSTVFQTQGAMLEARGTVNNMYKRKYRCSRISRNCRYTGWYQTNPPYNGNFGWTFVGNDITWTWAWSP